MLNIKNYQTKSGYSGLTKILNRILKDDSLNNKIKEQINEIYFINFLNKKDIDLEKAINQLNNIKINCKICNQEYSLFDICPYELEINKFKNRNGLYNFTDEFINNNYKENKHIKKHVNYILDIQKKRILLNNITKIYNNHKKINDWNIEIYNYLEKQMNNFDYGKNYEELYNSFNIEVCKCKICKTPLYFFNQNCPNIGTKQGENGKYSVIDKDLNKCNKKEILHIKYRQNASSYGAWKTKKKLMSEDKEYNKKMRDTSKLNTEESHKKSKKALQNHIQNDPEWWNNVNEAKIKTRNENGFTEKCNANLYRGQDPIINERIKQTKIKNGTDKICNQNLIRDGIKRVNNDNIEFMKLLPELWKNSSFYMIHSWAVRNNLIDDLNKDYIITNKNIQIINLNKPINRQFNNEKEEKYFHWRRIVLQYIYNRTICKQCGKHLDDVNQEFCSKECKEKYFKENNNFYILNIWKNNNKDLIKELEKQIVGLTEALNNYNNCLIYGFYFNDVLFYLGETIDFGSRIIAHLKNIIDFPQYWMFWKELSIKFEIKVIKYYNEIENFNKKDKMEFLRKRESEMILKLNPLIQKCINGNDDIIHLEQRNFKEICCKLNINYEDFQILFNTYIN